MVVVLFVCLAGLTPVVGFAWWMFELGRDAGDRPGDATSRVGAGTGGYLWLSVANHSLTPVVVGAHTRDERPFASLFQAPALVVRPARRHERRQAANWSETVLGAVAPGAEMRWPVPAVVARTRLVVALGQSGDRLRIHDHLLVSPLARGL
jgi:hypothetical protein